MAVPIIFVSPPRQSPCLNPSPLSPLRLAPSPRGIEPDQFESLLNQSRRTHSPEGRRKSVDLRKEIALRAHNVKQAQRRALFLSKVLAPPLPEATALPKTPPESPSVFHYSLPSPGLDSPLTLFESLSNDPAAPDPWVEQVHFRLLEKPSKDDRRSSLPSLAEITARLNPRATIERSQSPSRRLPSFLQSRRTRSLDDVLVDSPSAVPVLEITTTIVPPTPVSSHAPLTKDNLLALDARARMSRDMLSAIRRRTDFDDESTVSRRIDVSAEISQPRTSTSRDMLSAIRRRTNPDEAAKDRRRISAPAELQPRARTGFEHPVLSIPGGF